MNEVETLENTVGVTHSIFEKYAPELGFFMLVSEMMCMRESICLRRELVRSQGCGGVFLFSAEDISKSRNFS